MSNSAINEQRLQEVAKKAVQESLRRIGVGTSEAKSTKPTVVEKTIEAGKNVIKEALVVLPKTFILKTQWLSAKTKAAHERLYQNYVSSFNAASTRLDTVSRQDVTELRHLKQDETKNLNAVKLHELYFGNISDQQSQIHRDSLPFMRLGRDWGTFENWQFDFRAVAEAAGQGWAVLYYDPFKDRYLHAMIGGHTKGVPLGGIPVLVLDMHEHAYFVDFQTDKTSYINAMMREINWSVVEARMVIAERAQLKDLYLVRPLVDNTPTKMIDQATNAPPIGKDQVTPGGVEQIPAPGSAMQMQVGAQQNKVQ